MRPIKLKVTLIWNYEFRARIVDWHGFAYLRVGSFVVIKPACVELAYFDNSCQVSR